MSPPAAFPARRRFGHQFVQLARAWRRELDHVLAGASLTDATWVPLVRLEESGEGISQKDLATRIGIDGSSLVRLLDILEERGLLERRADAKDRRSRRLHLTAAGREALADIRRQLHAVEEEILADLGEDEIGVALRLFDRIGTRLDRMQDARRKAS